MIRIKYNTISAIYFYWVVIILWQTIRPVANRSTVDVLVKMGCFAALCIYGYNRRNLSNTRKIMICIVIFLMTQSITYMSDTITVSTLITGVFMFAQILVFLIFLRNATIQPEELDQLGSWVVISAMVMCIYNVLFNTNRFLLLFTSSGAYGSECKSFLYSNHEFAIYITVAIIFIIWKVINRSYKKLPAFIILLFLLINLLSTYSRTAILGGIAAIFVLVYYFNKKYFVALCVFFSGFAIYVSKNMFMYNFIFDKILKGSFENSGGLVDDGRASMYREEVHYFSSGSFMQKLFGHGYVSGGASGGHNAYLYILNIGGIIMFAFFLLIIIWSFTNSFRCVRYNRSIGSVCLGFQVFACLYMAAQTPILFFSTMDSYYITMIMVLVPMYCLNALKTKYLKKQYFRYGGDVL